METLKTEIERLVRRGATEYAVIDGVRRLSFPDGRLALTLPAAEADPDSSIARFALERIALREYAQCEGKVVLVNWLSGYDESDCSRDVYFGQPIRVRVDRHQPRDNILRWMDNEHLDPIWDVELSDNSEPVLAGMRSFWIYAASRSLSGKIEPSDVVAVESPRARLSRVLGIGKRAAGNAVTRI